MSLKTVYIDQPKSLHPLVERTDAIRQSLVAQYRAGRGAPNEVVGNEREVFIRTYLSNAYPPQFRWSSGFILDSSGYTTGQLDIVVETNLGLSIPASGVASERLFFAEMVAAVISVKSNLFAQWSQIEKEAEKIQKLNLERHSWLNMGKRPDHIPFFVVAYSGASAEASFDERISREGLGGVLHSLIVLDSNLCLLRSGEGEWTKNCNESSFLMFAASLHKQIAGAMEIGQTIWPYVCETDGS